MQDALNDPECARAVDGGTGIAAETLADNLGTSDPDDSGFGTITMASLPMNEGGETVTTGTVDATDQNGNLYFTGQFTSTITLSSNPIGLFMNPWLGYVLSTGTGTGYSNTTFQAIELGHELGHGSANYGAPSAIVNESGNAGLSMQNTQTIANACFPQGDFGGNQGPVDQGSGDVPAVARPVKHHF
jgi:hypothetical protein